MIRKDELIGAWYSGADEDSIYHNMVQGFGAEFKVDGAGILHHWDGEAEALDKTSSEKPFQWQRIDAKTIKIQLESSTTWEEISYEIEPFITSYGPNTLFLVIVLVKLSS